MLHYLAPTLAEFFGPLRLFRSFSFLMIVGLGFAFLLTWYVLPRVWSGLPRDRGRANTPRPDAAAGKPTGAGFALVLTLLPLLLLVMPWWPAGLEVLACLVLIMLAGYGDDRATVPWGEAKKGLLDLAVAFAASAALCQWHHTKLWIPLEKGTVVAPPLVFIAVSTITLWLAINATNCSDGVDGLAGTLTLLSVFYMGAFLYVVIGHVEVANYLLVPHNPDGARWAVMLFTMAGGLAGYLWHNAEPSRVLMGDAGSRFLGLLVGCAAMAAGNPFLIVVAAPVVLVNGGTGLVKVSLLRIFRRLGFDITGPAAPPAPPAPAKDERMLLVRLLHKVRFPLHDHCRKNLKWSNAQVLMRFSLVQAFATPILLGLLVKVR